MQFSFSELKDLIFNAGLGANLNVGTCEDVALAVAILESQNIHGSDEFLYAIACKRKFTAERGEACQCLTDGSTGKYAGLLFKGSRMIFEKKLEAALLAKPGLTQIVGRRRERPFVKPFLLKSESNSSAEAFWAP